jgi:hypothetical protein
LNTLVVDEQKYHHNDVLENKTDSDFPNFGKLNNFYPIHEFDDKDQECLIDFDQTILDDIEDKVSLTTTITNQSKNINLSPNYHSTSLNNLENEEFNFKMENFSADFDSSSIFGDNYFMDELMLPNFVTDDLTSSLPVVYHDINEHNNSTIEYIDPATLTTTTTLNDNIAYDFTILENVFETNDLYHNDQAINISEDKSPNLYINDMIIDNNNILSTSNNNNNHYSNINNMMVSEELNHISESTQEKIIEISPSALTPLKISPIKDDFNNNTTNLTTPDIANQIFDLEHNTIVLETEQTELENFDLIEYITSPNGTMTSFDDDIQEPSTPTKMTTKRKYSEYQESSSTCSSIGSPAPSSSKKRRGRPPKPLDEIPEIQVDSLNDNDIKYLEMRNKNNLASRRSRMNRKHREIKDEVEANKLEDEYRKLVEQENNLIKECGKWKRAVMRLAAL